MIRDRKSVTAAIFGCAAVTVVVCAALLVTASPQLSTDRSALERRGEKLALPNGDKAPRAATDEGSRPVRLLLPSIDVSAAIVPTGVRADGYAQIPRDGDVVGWYRYGSAPGEPEGTSVVIGHRDTVSEGPGALFEVDRLSPGDSVRVDRVKGQSLRYQVVSVESVAKAALPSSLFRRAGSPRLVVVTCGGPFLPDKGGYQENVIVTALPVNAGR